MKIRKDDSVIVISGKNKGKKGKIIAFNKNRERVYVGSVNMLKKYVRPNPQKNIKGGMVEKEGSLAVSNIMYFCNECGKGVKLGYKVTKDNKQRQCKECSTLIG